MGWCEHDEGEAELGGPHAGGGQIRSSYRCLRTASAGTGQQCCFDCDQRLVASLRARKMVAEAEVAKTDDCSDRGLRGSAGGPCEDCAGHIAR